MKATHVAWFNGRGCSGIIRIEDPYGSNHYRIGAVRGYNEAEDVQDILDWGARFDNNAGDLMLAENRFTKL
jgi:hypothetical protein